MNDLTFHRFRYSHAYLLFGTALGIRLAYITLAHTYHFRPYQEHFAMGWEMGRIARALVEGRGYADPFAGHTGPTAWVPPLYPIILAAVFKLFGIYTMLSAWFILAINSVFSAATAILIYEIAARCFDHKVAIWSSWIWALYPAALQYAVHWIWEMSLTVFLFSALLVLLLRMRGIGENAPLLQRQPLRRWLLLGLVWGLIALSNSALLLFLPACLIWLMYERSMLRTRLTQLVAFTIVFLALISPWIARNWISLHAFVPMRSNLGVELWAWNNSDANGIALGAPIQPVAQDPSFIPYAKMGEIAYSRYRGAIAKHWIAAHPGRFAMLSLTRFYFFWASVPHPLDRHPAVEYFREVDYCLPSITGVLGLIVALRNRRPAAGLFAWAFILLPFVYYFVSVAARFRHPLEPLITILSVYLFQSAKRHRARVERP